MTRPTVSTRPIGPDRLEVRTACQHGAYRTGFQLGEVLTAAVAVTAAISTHHIKQGCGCMRALWHRYRTGHAPADLDALRRRFESLWADIGAQQQRQGYAVVDWAGAVRTVRGAQ